VLERDAGYTYLTANGVNEDPESPMTQLLGSSITYRVAMGPQQGRKVFTLQTLPEVRTFGRYKFSSTAFFALQAGISLKWICCRAEFSWKASNPVRFCNLWTINIRLWAAP
jgi:hypothetical protein